MKIYWNSFYGRQIIRNPRNFHIVWADRRWPLLLTCDGCVDITQSIGGHTLPRDLPHWHYFGSEDYQ